MLKKLLIGLLVLGTMSAFAQIKIGDRIMEDYSMRSLQTVEAISNDLFYLSNGEWYHTNHIHKLQNEYDGIQVGEMVMENFVKKSLLTVVAISNNLFHLSDGKWYPPKYIVCP
ncbi:MAG: hypothetical protein KAQ98_10985 [Bacteriovoracaceae bacterium]|nr:hypothetical protein [Bacteriovoracaceae bacterium]